MATPANRVPVRIARGTKANLDTAMTAGDLKEGEICYAEDENGLYVVEGGVLVQAGADLSSITVDELSDVEYPTVNSLVYTSFSADSTPEAGEWYINSNFLYLPRFDASGTDQALNYRSISGTTSLTINVDGTDHVLTNATILLDELDDTNVRILINGDNIATIDGAITKSGSATISCPDFPVPSDAPVTEGDILKYDLSAAKYKPVRHDLNALLDVNTIDTLPADGQQLVWDDTAGRWENSNASIDKLSDVDLGLPAGGEGYEMQQGSYLNSGEFQTNGGSGLLIDKSSKNGQGDMPIPAANSKLYFSTTAGGPFTELDISGGVGSTGANAYVISFADRSALDAVLTGSTTIYWSLGAGVVDGDLLVYNETDGTFQPSAGITSVNDQTGAVSLGAEDLDNVQIGYGTSVTRATTATSNNTNSGNVGTYIIGSGYTYWAYEPDSRGTGTVLDFLENDATLPIDVDINGTTVTIDSAAFSTGTGNSNQLRLQHSALVSTGSITGTNWTLTVPDLELTNGQILQYNSTSSKWENAVAPGTGSIDLLGDVDTSTSAPEDGESLRWNDSTSNWEPSRPAIAGLSDTDLTAPLPAYWATKGAHPPAAGAWSSNGTNAARMNPVDSNGTDWSSEMTTLGTTGTFWYSTDGTSWTSTTNTGGFDDLPTSFQFGLSPFNVTTYNGGLYISFVDPTATAPEEPLDNEVLQYNSTSSKWEAGDAAGVRALLGIEEYVDDAAAGSGGVASGALYYNTTNSNYVLKS